MKKYRIIGNMTGNSMDAIDLVLTEFDGDKMTDICTFSRPYSVERQRAMENFRRQRAVGKSREEIEGMLEFRPLHDDYIQQIAECIQCMLKENSIDKSSIDAIGFHGKTLDHNPPSKAKTDGTLPYTLQVGSGQMLSDLTGIRVVYDFRSEPLMAGFDGAPLVPPHNAHIAATEGDGCYYNGGNTSNFAWIIGGKAQVGSDAGPFNEYIDNFIRKSTSDTFDKNGKYGLKGVLNKDLLQKLFNLGRDYYERPLPKSGDPAYYKTDEVLKLIQQDKIPFNDAVHTLEYFASYVAVHALTLTDKKIKLPPSIILFGGGWKNPVVRSAFDDIINGKGYVLPEHQNLFESFLKRFTQSVSIRYSTLGEFMEARLFADLARYKLENKVWEIPEIVNAGKKVICGVIAEPTQGRTVYNDCINMASKGWQFRQNIEK